MRPSRRARSIDFAESVRNLPASPPNPHRVCVHRDDVVWIAAGDGRSGIVDAGAVEAAGLARFAADSLRNARWTALVERFGLDFTIAARLHDIPGLLCTRGPAARVPLYLATGAHGPVLATRLWSDGNRTPPSPDYLRHVLANAYLPSPSEADHTLGTAARAWLRTPRGAVVAWRDGRVTLLALYGCPPTDGAAELDAVATRRLREAVDDRIRAVAASRCIATELSGGIDSGIIAARAAALLADRFKGGVTLTAPYHELRRERAFVDATLAQARTTTKLVPIEAHLPFAALRTVPVHDEPSLSALASSLLTGVLSVARELGADLLCHGIGGDQVFANHGPSRFSALAGWRDGLDFAAAPLRLQVRATRRQLRRIYFGGARCLRRSPAFLLHDGWYDRYLAPALGVRYEGVFVDLRILRACDALRALLEPGDANLPKSIPRRVFEDELAPIVRERRGKAGFDGVYQRGLRRNIDDVCGLIDDEARTLCTGGVNPARLIRRLRACAARGWGSRDTPAFAALAWVVWVHALRREQPLAKGA